MARRTPTDIENLDMKWHVIRLLIPYLLEFKKRTLLAFICLGLAKLSSISLPFFMKYIVDNLDTQMSPAAGSNTAAVVAIPIMLIIAYGLFRFFNVMFNEIRDTLFGRVTERTIRRVSLQTFRHLHNLDLDFHLNRQTGGLSRDIERGNSGINFLLRFLIFNIIPTLLELLVVIGIFLGNYGFAFAGIIVLAIVVYVGYSVIATEKRTRFIREMNLADSETNTRAIDSLLNYETVKYFTNEEYEARHFDEGLEALENAKRNNRLSLFALNGGQALIVSLAMTGMLLLAAQGVADGSMTLGDFTLVNMFMMQLFIPLNFLGFVYREIKGAMANIERMFELLAEKPGITEKADAVAIKFTRPSIEFKNVSFHYRPDREIIQDISFTIQPGQKLAVVGASGSGKSTLVKLLFRFYDCQSGSIEIDGNNILDLTLHSLRSAIGIVPQDTVLFNDTIYENIRYGRPDASEEEIRQAIRMAHLDDFIERLPEGMKTLVGERGLKLSGGEKQRVAIARTMLKNPAILVFDEATSSLDSKTEGAILKAMREISEGHTSLVIAHRLSTVVDADQILVLEQGRFVEAGTHDELLARQGTYHHMWFLQQQQEKSEATTADSL
jgi:ABC-type transport system involved in Fe-S cluster assembly fused permease/ATPase subunit